MGHEESSSRMSAIEAEHLPSEGFQGSADPIIEVRGLSQSYGDVEVLHEIDLVVYPGEVFGFLGHNGAGKTTTLNVLTTLLAPTKGSALVCDALVVGQFHPVTNRALTWF